ncbi:MAG: hypothetical protein M1819_006384 [Sarea resinae]|nr:MAG: hypothetical protein M1819_006384 [Sarea resinae]
MTDYERTVLNHYGLNSPYPTEWPADKDDSDDSDVDLPNTNTNPNSNTSPPKADLRRSRSRYSALERRVSDRRHLVPGAEKTNEGVENLVQKDEPDPLGATDSVVRILRSRGLPVDDDSKLRNRFLLSSTTFSPALFLSQVHSNSSTQSLLQGLDFLSRSIDQKSASLKVLVESNFERFVRAKATIDNVYTEMRNQGAEVESERRGHSRQSSRSNGHLRSSSAGVRSVSPSSQRLGGGKKKNALTKESEYGVQGIKGPLLELSVKAGEVWGPALGGKEREDSLKAVLNSVERYKGVFELAGTIADCIKRKDYELLVEEYHRARRFANDAKDKANAAARDRSPLTDVQIHQIVITARMWADVEEQIQSFKRDVWRKLTAVQPTQSIIDGVQPDEHIEYISILLELGVQDNPIWVWLLSRYDHLKQKIALSSERFKIEVEILRRHLANGEKPSPKTVASHLRSAARQGLRDKAGSMDTVQVIELWERIHASLNSLLAIDGGILGEVVDFWETAQSFIDGKAQKTLPIGIDGQSQKHHQISADGVRELRNGAAELIDLVRENVFSFFADPPIEDISMLFTPIPPTPDTPGSATLSPKVLRDLRFKFDPAHLPPPSPKRGEAWEKFAFWPPYSNSLSGVHYLSRLLVLVGTAASEMAALGAVQNNNALERLRSLVSGARERCVQAVCEAWNKDAENCKVLEDWTRAADRRDVTKMPAFFVAFESSILGGMQKILYISEAMSKAGADDVVTPPPAKLLQMVRSQFVTSLYKALSGMVESAEKSDQCLADEWGHGIDFPAQQIHNTESQGPASHRIDASNRNVRMLLTLSNLQTLRSTLVPQLIGQFETNFSVKLTSETSTIATALSEIEGQLFTTYTTPTITTLRSLVARAIASLDWEPTTHRPVSVRPYIYTALLQLVLLHSDLATTSPALAAPVLSHTLEHLSLALLEAFKARGARARYSLPALMQATLDVEFVAQTLSQYTSDRVSEITSQIYLELDRGTDNDARKRLQDELPEMRAILKRLRESTRGEFACFRKVRPPHAPHAQSGGREREREREK